MVQSQALVLASLLASALVHAQAPAFAVVSLLVSALV